MLELNMSDTLSTASFVVLQDRYFSTFPENYCYLTANNFRSVSLINTSKKKNILELNSFDKQEPYITASAELGINWLC